MSELRGADEARVAGGGELDVLVTSGAGPRVAGWLVAGLVVVAFAVFAAGAATARGSGHHRHPAAHAATRMKRVERHIATAFDEDDYVIAATVRNSSFGDGIGFDAWFDPTTQAGRVVLFDANGSIRDQAGTVTHDTDVGQVTPRTQLSTVDFLTRTWWTQTTRVGDPGMIHVAENVGSLAQQWGTPEVISQGLAGGTLKVVGRETVEGQNAIGLQMTNAGTGGTVWVSASTYELLSIVSVAQEDGASGQARDVFSTIDFSWDPRSPASLADLQVQIPAGFTKVTAPPVGQN